MSNYDTIKERLTFEEARLETLTTQVSATKALVKTLKTALAKAEPEAVKKNKQDSDGLPLTEVRDEGETEVFVFTDGKTSKIETVKK